MLSLPIPDKNSPIRYLDIRYRDADLGMIVSSLAAGRIPRDFRAHLDPDLRRNSLVRMSGWKPMLGQVGIAQAHLRKMGVGVGDLFVFFGLFRRAHQTGSTLKFIAGERAFHAIWGWLQIDQVVAVDNCASTEMSWARYHPHFHRSPDSSNTLYIGSDHLDLVSDRQVPGAGAFGRFTSKLQLTDFGSNKLSTWKLPKWFFPASGRQPMSYHSASRRWRRKSDHVLLETVGRGQEFVLNCDYYPEAAQWVADLIRSNSAWPE